MPPAALMGPELTQPRDALSGRGWDCQGWDSEAEHQGQAPGGDSPTPGPAQPPRKGQLCTGAEAQLWAQGTGPRVPGRALPHRGPSHCSSCLKLSRTPSSPHVGCGLRDEGGEMPAGRQQSHQACQSQWGRKLGPRLRGPARLPGPPLQSSTSWGRGAQATPDSPYREPSSPHPQPGPNSTQANPRGPSPKGPEPGWQECPDHTRPHQGPRPLSLTAQPWLQRLSTRPQTLQPSSTPLWSVAPKKEEAGKDPSPSPTEVPLELTRGHLTRVSIGQMDSEPDDASNILAQPHSPSGHGLRLLCASVYSA